MPGRHGDPVTRFFRHFEIPDDPEACWLWNGAGRNERYRNFSLADGRSILAHKFAYELFHGEPAPNRGEGAVHHRCEVKCCVNPWHLHVMGAGEHTKYHFAKGMSGNACANRIACPAGHPYTPENTYHRRDRRGRHCLTCARIARQSSRGKAWRHEYYLRIEKPRRKAA